MRRHRIAWGAAWPFVLLWMAAPAPLYIWLFISLLMKS